jgi:hypothetical protein
MTDKVNGAENTREWGFLPAQAQLPPALDKGDELVHQERVTFSPFHHHS